MSTATMEVELVPNLPVEELRSKLISANRATDVGHRELAFYLSDMDARRVQQALGYPSTVAFAVKCLGMSRRQARDLLAVGKALVPLARIDAAFGDGVLSWTQTRLLAKVATPATEAAWIERAARVSCADLEREVAVSEPGAPPRADRRGLPHSKFEVRARIGAVAFELWEKVRARVAAAAGQPLGDDELIHAIADRVLRDDAPDSGASRGARCVLVVQRCTDCGVAGVMSEDGLLPIDAATAERIACDAPTVRLDENGDPVRDDKTPPELRSRVLARDGHRCLLCGGTIDLHAHHVARRGAGGPTVARNLATLCTPCHTLVHDEFIILEGVAPHGLRATDREGRPLGRPVDRAALRKVTRRIEAERSGGACAPLGEAPMALARIPAEVDADWWRRHRHLLSWNDRRGVFEFEAGAPMADEPERISPTGGARAPRGHRPVRFSEVRGQSNAVDSLGIAVAAARKLGRPVGHVLLSGPPGLGKTTLALALATESGTRAAVLTAPLVRDPGVLIAHLAGLGRGDVLFIDEIHALPARAAEALYGAMEDFSLDLPVTDGSACRTLTLSLSPFTLVAATTEPENVLAPLRSRFGLELDLVPYDEDALQDIVRDAANRQDLSLEPGAVALLAGAAQGAPRAVVRLVRWVRDAAVAAGRSAIDADFALETLARAGLDAQGLGPVHRRILDVLESRGPDRPIGLGSLAALVSLSERALREVYEPPLLRLGLVRRSFRGRVIGGAEVARTRLHAV